MNDNRIYMLLFLVFLMIVVIGYKTRSARNRTSMAFNSTRKVYPHPPKPVLYQPNFSNETKSIDTMVEYFNNSIESFDARSFLYLRDDYMKNNKCMYDMNLILNNISNYSKKMLLMNSIGYTQVKFKSHDFTFSKKKKKLFTNVFLKSPKFKYINGVTFVSYLTGKPHSRYELNDEKTFYILGDIHESYNSIRCPPRKKKWYENVSLFLSSLLVNTPVFIDFFLETEITHNKQDLQSNKIKSATPEKIDEMYWENLYNTLENQFDIQKYGHYNSLHNTISFNEKCIGHEFYGDCPYSNTARVHNVDLRQGHGSLRFHLRHSPIWKTDAIRIRNAVKYMIYHGLNIFPSLLSRDDFIGMMEYEIMNDCTDYLVENSNLIQKYNNNKVKGINEILFKDIVRFVKEVSTGFYVSDPIYKQINWNPRHLIPDLEKEIIYEIVQNHSIDPNNWYIFPFSQVPEADIYDTNLKTLRAKLINKNYKEFYEMIVLDDNEYKDQIIRIPKKNIVVHNFYQTAITDIYTILRMFKTYNNYEQDENKRQPSKSNFCVYYGGETHAKTIREVLEMLGYKMYENTTSSKQKYNLCLNMRPTKQKKLNIPNIRQPFFYPDEYKN